MKYPVPFPKGRSASAAVHKRLKKAPCLLLLLLLLCSSLAGIAQITPPGISGLQLWLDAADVNNDGSTPADATVLTTWKDKSGNGRDATVLAGQSGGTFYLNQINGNPVVRFTRTSTTVGNVYRVSGLDIRAITLPAVTIFTVYRQGAQVASTYQGLWGNDNGNWDRFFLTTNVSNVNNGLASLGPTYMGASVTGAGIPNIVRLMTAVYNHLATDGSKIYFDGKVITTFKDQTDASNAQTDFRIGFDGDNNPVNADIAELVVYNRVLSECEIQQVNRYLNGKYGTGFTSVAITAGGPTSFYEGGSVVLTSTVTGTAYQWLKEGLPISGATNNSYTATTAGNYALVVTNTCNDTSAATAVTILPSAPGGKSSDLTLWYRGDAGVSVSGASVTQWNNQASASYPLLPTGSGEEPVYNSSSNLVNFNPVLRFDGTNDRMRATGMPIAVVAGGGTPYSSSHYIVYRKIGGSNNTLYQHGAYNQTTPWTIGALMDGRVCITNRLIPTAAAAANEVRLQNFDGTSSAAASFLNGTQRSTTLSGTQSPSSYQDFIIGGHQVSGSYSNADIAEFIVYNVAQGSTNRTAIESYLGIKYGITLGHNYTSSAGTVVYNVASYNTNIAGVGRDDASKLMQKQAVSQNTSAAGAMVTIGIDAIATTNAGNAGSISQDQSFLIWGDDNGTVNTTTATDLPSGLTGCATRFAREWKIMRTGTGIGATQVQFNLTGTAAVSTNAADYRLMIDRDGNGDFTNGTITRIAPASLAGGVLTFNNVAWDSDLNGTDIFCLVMDAVTNMPPPSLIASNNYVLTSNFTCSDTSGYLQFTDASANPSAKYLAIKPNGNSGYNFTVYASNDSAGYINNRMMTDGSSNTTALLNRMYTIRDAGANSYSTNGGMTVRLYYSAADSSAAVNALDPAVTGGTLSLQWFKISGTSGSVMAAKAAQNANGMSTGYGVSLLTPDRYGEEAGIRYVEFDHITSFSTFGALVKRGGLVILPLHFTEFSASVLPCSVNLKWEYQLQEGEGDAWFAVQRAAVNGSFETVHECMNCKTYQEELVANGKWYYRIVTKNLSGQLVYSKTVVADIRDCAAARPSVQVFPNPATSEIVLTRSVVSADATYELLTQSGRPVRKGALPAGVATVKIELQGLSKGVYLIKVVTQTGVSVNKVVVR
ncbi:MAG: hypothetical protein DI535_22785 [Citrobacter freundii]|nr:MAG: hypothetical protein DI535_22785 [Citrobacter freundii]